ncbi:MULTISPECIES: pentapeptide repeat-containing protein [Gemella]|uniref:pentapeptide repeat-containing protein n=1 Tax=Gemella TaxID=1378 RepID=UPI000767ECE3|nr:MULTISPECIES: pentapeptide repeat-containing protein [Gemella]AME09056.1 hypothetical protein AXE85_02205 [Gemella sp. oral taxon 928]AXI26628.1 pentapeptide repeat-containing protein [Gemella sp. ND 6198]
MKIVNLDKLKNMLHNRTGRLNLSDIILENCDLRNYDLSNIDFSNSNFINVRLDNVNFSNSSLKNCLLDDCSLKNANFKNSNLQTASLRRADLEGANISGANLYGAILENANLKNIKFDNMTKNFTLHCPEEGAFIAYKKCINNLIVKLLIPGDAKRVSSTMNCCRCDKAKVLEIKSFDGTKHYDEAWSTVDNDFCYKLGEWAFAKNFNEDRWYDSTGGIHFWMSEEEAKAY